LFVKYALTGVPMSMNNFAPFRLRATIAAAAATMSCVAAFGLAGEATAAWAAPKAAPATCARGPQPPGRVWGSWAYDPATRQVVLFGGDKTDGETARGVVFDGTWTWKNGVWTRRHPATSPSSRTGAAIAYDYASRQLLLFGGSRRPGTGGGFSDQTWIWNGRTWVLLHPAGAPSARHNADLVYDAASHKLILFGGYGGSYLNDTWAWNGSTWIQLHPATSPAVRDTHSLVYDQAVKSVILWSGYNGVNLTDTWSWNGTNWTRLTPATSPTMQRAAWQAGYDPATRQLLVFGGNGGGNSAQTWNWTGTTWRRLHPAHSPRYRKYGSVTYDAALREPVLFGGFDGTKRPGSVWGWTGRTWRLIGCRS
jgi:hypothetical protein